MKLNSLVRMKQFEIKKLFNRTKIKFRKLGLKISFTEHWFGWYLPDGPYSECYVTTEIENCGKSAEVQVEVPPILSYWTRICPA